MKLSIAIDMGAKNNGVFVVKSDGNRIVQKKATTIIVDEKSINFSKKSRRENRHKDRNYKRRKLAKRLLKEFIDFKNYDEKQQDLILGLLNNRGYTFISTSTEFETLNDETVEFINKYFSDLKGLIKKEDFEKQISSFEDLEELKEYVNSINDKITIETNKKKNEFYKEFQSHFTIIKKDLKTIKSLFLDALKEFDTGSKPRIKYFQEIKEEIEREFDFVREYSKIEFFNLVGNISNLQLRVLRKYFNNKFNDNLDLEKLNLKLKTYFKAFHYNSDKEKAQKKELFEILDNQKDIKKLLLTTNPNLTIPPYEDMNNRSTYKCNSMLIKPDLITEDIKKAIDFLLKKDEFSNLLISENGVFEKESLIKTKVVSNNKKIKEDFSYSKYLQRILDATEKITTKELNPRNVFKHKSKFEKGRIDSVELFKKEYGIDIYNTLKTIAEKYYEEEEKILNGIYEESNSIFQKCNRNTPYKNNAKHILLKPIYSYNFSNEEADKFIEAIKNSYGLQKALERVSTEAKKYQNGFYNIVEACYKNEKCVDDKDIKAIIKDLKNSSTLLKIKNILENELNIKNSCFENLDSVNEDNLKRVINIFKQTYEILFKDLGGFNKTCKECTKENSIRSDEKFVIAKRLLSDVAKPIDGMLDMMLDRLAYEISNEINENDIKDIDTLEILLEQNKFEFEENLITIKKASNDKIKQKKIGYKDKLNSKFCPYNGEDIEKIKGEYDHILPQSKEVYNSKANLIYCSSSGNREKSNTIYTLNNLNKKHLQDIFQTDSIENIQTKIEEGMKSIDEKSFTNFNNLKLNQQISMRYSLFMRNTPEFDKAYRLVKLDKIKTIPNGTQKRLARLIYEKLLYKFPILKDIDTDSKTVKSELVSATRSFLAEKKEELKKLDIQPTHSHCIDSMIVFYLANSKINGQKHRQKENITTLEPIFDFNDIYLDENVSLTNKIYKQSIKNRILNNKKINSIASTEVLFRENAVSVHYLNIYIENGKFFYGETKKSILKFTGFNQKILDYFLKLNILNEFDKNCYRVNINNLNSILFNEKQSVIDNIDKFSKIDFLRYTTQKKDIIKLFKAFIKKECENYDEINYNNVMKYFVKFNTDKDKDKDKEQTKHKKIRLKIFKSWDILSKYLVSNKESFIQVNGNSISIKNDEFKNILQKSVLFKKTHKPNRKITQRFSLPLKDMTDRCFIVRRSDNKGNTIYQYLFAQNSARGFVGDIYIHNGDKNIIPASLDKNNKVGYLKAFSKNETYNSK